ncbi:MAG: DNA polymerase III subunit beta [Bacteroidaceae bacterium]|nr:DNA polymerase III subunit beta [Bacteroidaceae bacterium]
MKFSVSSATLCNRMQIISRVQNSKNSLAILNCVLFELNDGVLRLTASDSETTIETSIQTNECDGDGIIAIDAKQLINSIKEIPEQPITFDINENNFAIEITYQNGKYNLIGQNGHEYPQLHSLTDVNNTICIPSATLANGISRALFATAEDELRPQMNGIYFDISSDYTTLVASDGHKLVRNRILSVKGEPYSFNLPKKPALMLKTILPKEENSAIISFNDRNAKIELTDFSINCRLIEGRYPNYNSVIPTDNPFKVRVDRVNFISALRRVSVSASASSSLIKLHVENNTLTTSAQDIDFSTSAEEHIMCEYDGGPLSIGFNGPFLIDVLNSIACQDVILELADPSRAGVIVPAEQEEDEDVIMLLMPMMLQD